MAFTGAKWIWQQGRESREPVKQAAPIGYSRLAYPLLGRLRGTFLFGIFRVFFFFFFLLLFLISFCYYFISIFRVPKTGPRRRVWENSLETLS